MLLCFYMNSEKVVIFCAPSGAGKTTITKEMLKSFPDMSFSISATNREPRGIEKNGTEYFFVSTEEFKRMIDNDEFVEWMEVFPGRYYGSLRREVSRLHAEGKIAVFDIDVKGAVNLKNIFGDKALMIFVKAPIVIVEQRLLARNTDDAESIKARIARIPEEMTYESKADFVLENIDLQKAVNECREKISEFLNK